MPQWFYQRPPEQADPNERLVADALNALGENWTIRWGWFYEDNAGAVREGDFLILGPGGHVLVLEVKGTQMRSFALTGYWENENGSDPVEQLEAEWKAALRMLEATAAGSTAPFVHRAFALPNLHLLPGNDAVDRIPPDRVLDHRGLGDFGTWWQRNAAKVENRCTESRSLFLKTFAKGIKPESLKLFIRDSERLFARYKGTEMNLLKRVWPNRQLLVKGGPGTGKTFMALQTAKHFAEADGGNDVLFVCYNLALGGLLADMAARLKPDQGSITVATWEHLAARTLAEVGIEHQAPEDYHQRSQYYDVDLPGYLHLAVSENLITPRFDALVVDEGQDLDTRFPNEIPAAPDQPGWWTFLLRLLRTGPAARAAVFFDPAQRPSFRPEQFHIDDLVPVLSQPAIVHLDQAVRFTRPLFAFLREAAGDPSHPLVADLIPHERAPEGPAVELRQASPEDTAKAVEEILRGWFKAGLCNLKDVCLLGQRSRLEHSTLSTCTQLASYPLADYRVPIAEPANAEPLPHNTLRYLSLNRAKGLDFLAVILIDTPRHNRSEFLLACTRARQILGVVEPKR
ncbi:MAG: NERD domain-containing protein/DEAD/DEAH box helicase [Opitutales bacterium]|nr:NERD domain-containing protein/DEAD/DEAH box helicase [Opitutales bacterium]